MLIYIAQKAALAALFDEEFLNHVLETNETWKGVFIMSNLS